MTRADAIHIKLLLWAILFAVALLTTSFITNQFGHTNYERRQIDGVDCIVAIGSRTAVSCHWGHP